MLLIVGAIVAGVLIGLAFGGSFRNLARARFRWWPLAFAAAALQFVPVPASAGRVDEWVRTGLLVASYAAVIAFVAVNIRVRGLWLVAAGFALNIVVIGLNGGMPVSDHALRAAYGDRYPQQRRAVVEAGGAKHHLARPDDVATPLADVIPVGAPVHQVLSAGDVVWLVGLVWLVAGLMAGGAGGSAGGPDRDGATPRPVEASSRARPPGPSPRPADPVAPEPPAAPGRSVPP